jgi:hypothetical protein
VANPNERHIVYLQADGPFPYYDVPPDTVEASADDISSTGGRVESTAGGMDAAHSTARASVQGVLAGPMAAAPEPVRANMTQVMQAALFGGGSVRLFGSAIRTFNGGVTRLNEEYAAAATNDFGVAAATTRGTPAELLTASAKHNDAVAQARVELIGGLTSRYRDLRTQLDTDASNTAGMLDRGPNEADIRALWSSGSLSLAAVEAFPAYNLAAAPMTELPPELRGKSDEEIAKYALEHPELAATLLPALNEHTKQLIGEDLGRRGRTLGGGFDERQDGLKDEIDAFNKMLAAYGSDAVVATSFLNTIGPRGLLELNGRIATSFRDTSDLPGYHRDGFPFDRAYADSITAVQKTLGITLAAGTSGQPTAHDWTGDGSATYVSSDWVQQLMAEGRNKISIMSDQSDAPVAEVYGYQLLSPLLANGDHSPQFLNSVRGDMLDLEQKYAADNHGQLPWSSVKPGGMPGEAVRLDWTSGYNDKQDTAGWDPMTGLMRGLANDPEASRDFFTGDVLNTDPPRLLRLDYLMTDREWVFDQVDDPGDADARDNITGMADLGAALKTATTVDPTPESAQIVESIVHELAIDEEAHGYENGDFGRTGDKAETFEATDVIDPALRPALGDIMSSYINYVHQSMANDPSAVGPDQNGDWDPVLPGAQTFGARFNTHELSMVLADLGKDQGAHDALVQSENVYATLAYDHYLSGITDPHDIAAQAGRISNVSGSVLGALDYGASAAHHQTTVEADEKANDRIDLGFAAVNCLVAEIPGRESPLAGEIIKTLLQGAQEDMQHSHTGDSNYQIGADLTSGKQAQQLAVQAAIYRNMPPSALPPELQAKPEPASWSPEQQAAWRSFLRDKGQWSAEMQNAELNGGQDYTMGYADAQQRLKSW